MAPSTLLRSCEACQLTYSHFWCRVCPLSDYPVLVYILLANDRQLPFLNKPKKENDQRNDIMINLYASYVISRSVVTQKLQ